MLDISIKTLRDLGILAQHFLDMGSYIGLTEKECNHPKAAEWIIEELRNNDAALLLKMQMNVRNRINLDTTKETPLQRLADIVTGGTKGNHGEGEKV